MLANFDKKIIDITNPTGDIKSETINISFLAGYSVHISLSGSLACNSVINISNDDTAPNVGTKRFTVLQDSPQTLTAGQDFVYNAYWANYRFVQIELNTFTGSGEVKVYFVGKEI